MERTKILKVTMVTLALSGMGLIMVASPAQAQGRISKNALEKAKFYEAPREVQIIDDRPVVRDFREAPTDAGSIDLPPGPQGSSGGPGGGGAGALGSGAPSSIPGGGLPLGGPNPGYRTPGGGGNLPLPRSGFNGPSNIPNRGMSRGGLPDASSTNRLMGKMINPGAAKAVMAGPSRGMTTPPVRPRSSVNPGSPKVATYTGGYNIGTGSGFGANASQTNANVRGSLLKH